MRMLVNTGPGLGPETNPFLNSDNMQIGSIRYIPIVGIVVTISPNFSLYNIVVFPAASKPTEKIQK